MAQPLFYNIFSKLRIPVIVCLASGPLPVVYMNVRAGLLFSPTHSTSALSGEAGFGDLADVLHFSSADEWDGFCQIIDKAGQVDKFEAELLSFDGKKLPFILSGNCVSLDDGQRYFVLYLIEDTGLEDIAAEDYEAHLGTILRAAYLDEDVGEAIDRVLSMAGSFIRADRTYIFEEISPTMTRNTYEWCAEGIEPAIEGLQNLKKEDYNYDAIVEGGMYITDDVRELPEEDRLILEAQGIRSIAIIPFYENDRPAGYVSFDDCSGYRHWSHSEVDFLKNISDILGMLIHRRKTEQAALGNREILELLFDNSEDIIYVNRLDDYSLLFVSRALADSLGTTREALLGRRCWAGAAGQALLGRPCWQVLQKDQTGPCAFCPIPKIHIEPGEDRSEVYIWELANTHTGKAYIAKDNIIKWVDGQYVHVETATDISSRTEYEDQLRRLAAIDTMTGVNNRVWGSMVLEERFPLGGPGTSLCFLDIDGLKKTNDNFGHAAGDGLLTEVTEIIRRHLTPQDFACRWGGDEFILLLEMPPEDADGRIAQIQTEMAEVNKTSDKPYQLSFSYGIVPFDPATADSFDSLITIADEAMYQNKMTKRGMKRRKGD